MQIWFERFSRWCALSPENRRLALECVAELAAARIRLLGQPFKRVVSTLGEVVSESPFDEDTPEFARIMGRALLRCGRVVCWRGECLEQAIAGACILRRHGFSSTITLGTRRSHLNKLEAHAWLQCGTEIVVGDWDGGPDYATILTVAVVGKKPDFGFKKA